MGLHIVKREDCPIWKRCCFYVAAILFALVLGGVVLSVMGANPFEYYYQMFTMGMVGNPIAHETLIDFFKDFVPLTLAAVGLSLAFKMRFWNIGGEGQIIMGSLAAAFVAFIMGPGAPMWITLICMCLASMLVAGLYGLIAGVLKIKFGTNETLMTLMLNYIALYFYDYIAKTKADWNFFLDPQSPRAKFGSFSELASFPSIPIGPDFKLNICIPIVFVLGVLIFLYLKHTKQGYEINVVGDSPGTAHYAGMKVNRIILRTVFLSAALVGLAAAFKVGTAGILPDDDVTNNIGWDGIIIAWLAKLSTPAIFLVSALICVLQFGTSEASTLFGQVDSSFANMLQGAILFLVLAADFYTRFRVVRTKKGENK